jgi:D-serine deaminase-like pyridoxal phosphate-dependent protein
MKITEPVLILDKERCLKNIERMATKAQMSKSILRPHFKTHQSAEIGEWFRSYGVTAITVSSVKMAKYFAMNGWNDITIAFPVNILEIDEINKLASLVQLNILIVDSEVLPVIQNKITNNLGIFLKIDTGAHRTGMNPDNIEEIKKIISILETSGNIRFKGFLAHSGHTYQAKSIEEIRNIYSKAKDLMLSLKKNIFNNAIISIGDTPACSIVPEFSGADEIRPGNFVFYDIMQLELGACNEDNISVALAAPIVAKHKDRNEIIVYGGAVHLSKDFIFDKDGNRIYGYLVEFNEHGWGEIIKGAYVKSLSQEHGVIKITDDSNGIMDKNYGDLLGILPVHSCLTADLMGRYLTLDNQFIEMMKK